MKNHILNHIFKLTLFCTAIFLGACSSPTETAQDEPDKNETLSAWDAIKSATNLEYNALEFKAPVRQPLANPGWEDGIYISRDGNHLYYSAPGSDGKLAIYRAQQQTPGDWDSWKTREQVLSAGNSAGVGEPTVTEQGDLSFVVIYENRAGTEFDRYDADPWFMIKK